MKAITLILASFLAIQIIVFFVVSDGSSKKPKSALNPGFVNTLAPVAPALADRENVTPSPDSPIMVLVAPM
jgi:hypothetical protein